MGLPSKGSDPLTGQLGKPPDRRLFATPSLQPRQMLIRRGSPEREPRSAKPRSRGFVVFARAFAAARDIGPARRPRFAALMWPILSRLNRQARPTLSLAVRSARCAGAGRVGQCIERGMNTMNPKQAVPSAQRAVVSKPPLAVMVWPNGSARRRGAASTATTWTTGWPPRPRWTAEPAERIGPRRGPGPSHKARRSPCWLQE